MTVTTDISPDVFADMHANYIARQGKNDLIPRNLIVRVCSEAINRNHGIIIGLHSATLQSLAAALFIAHDTECAYMLMLARNDTAPRNAMAYLIWRSIEMMASRSRIFDFEGSTEPGVAQYYHSFGAQRTEMLQMTINRLPLIKI